MIMRHVTIQSIDLEKSVKFYQEVVGLGIQAELRGKGPHDIVFLSNATGETCIELIDDPAHAYSGAGISIGFAVEDVEAYQKELQEKGVEISPMISPNPTTRFFFTKDPNGVDIQFINE